MRACLRQSNLTISIFAVKEFPDKKVEELREIVENLEEQRNALPLIELLSQTD